MQRLVWLALFACALVASATDQCKDVLDMDESELSELFEKIKRDVNADADNAEQDDGEKVTDEERKSLFDKALEELKDLVKNNDFQMSLNKFSAMTEKEKEKMHGIHMTENHKREVEFMHKKREEEVSMMKRDGVKRTIPKSVNHCAATGPVETQNGCGSCYTFAATHALGGRMKVRDGDSGRALRISEQQAVDCTYGSDHNGCKGGWPTDVFEMYHRNKASTEARYPYTAIWDPNTHTTRCSEATYRVDPKMKEVHGRVWRMANKKDVDDIKAAVAEGPVAVAYETTSAYHAYRGGIFDTDDATCGQALNHGSILCGYDTDANGVEYWILKNSWGTSWGEDGYAKVRMGKDICGMESYVMVPLMDDAKTDTAGVCFANKECTSDSDCNNIKGACSSGKCNCFVCSPLRTCTSDSDCGGKPDSCVQQEVKNYDTAMGVDTVTKQSCDCTSSTECKQGKACSSDGSCGGKIGACTFAWNSAGTSLSKVCDCNDGCTKDKLCESDANCGAIKGSCRQTGWAYSGSFGKYNEGKCTCTSTCENGKECDSDQWCGNKAGACQELAGWSKFVNGEWVPLKECKC